MPVNKVIDCQNLQSACVGNIEYSTCHSYQYGSSNLSQPKVLHGNICAHEMNVVSTTSMLPRTVADTYDLLTVVFVCAGKFDPNCLGQIFTTRKSKGDCRIMNFYPEHHLLPH